MAFRLRRLPPSILPLLLVLAGCEPVPSSDSEAPALASQSSEIRIANSLTTKALVLNALSTNPTANELLGTNSLKSLFESPLGGNAYIFQQLRDIDAQTFMEYLVSCALPEGSGLGWYDPLTWTLKSWKGKAGLCPEWRDSAPSQTCLNRISACLLARNNAFGKRVELSMRGEHEADALVFSLEPVTRPADHDPDSGLLLDSVHSCATPTTGVTRDCGWRLDAIGQCTPGSPVTVGAGGKLACPGSTTLGSSTGSQQVLRVCAGTVGCDHGGSRLVAEAEGSCAGPSTPPSTTFSCPAEGYYSVMTAPLSSLGFGTATVAATSVYGLSEAEVFSMREGAYYGNIFKPSALAAKVEVVRVQGTDDFEVEGKQTIVRGAIYREMYSCYDPSWANASAYSSYRVCALPNSGANCAAKVTGACWTGSAGTSKCATQDGPDVVGDGDYEECKDPLGRVWREPVTVFLHDACGLMPPESKDRNSPDKLDPRESCVRTSSKK